MTMGYGRKIIYYIFKKRSERLTICYEPERKIQADSDRSDIRVFETGISTQQHGDNWQSTGNAEDEECSHATFTITCFIFFRFLLQMYKK